MLARLRSPSSLHMLVVFIAAVMIAVLPSRLAAQADNDPPVLTGLTIDPQSVNTTSEVQTVTITCSATDDSSGSGLNYAIVTLSTPSGGFGGQAMCDFENGSFVGNETTTLTIGRFVEPGNWGVSVHLAGMVGSQSYDSAALEELGFTDYITVDSTPDNTPPVLIGLTIGPLPIDTTHAPQTVTITCSATDAEPGSGLNYAIVTLNTPSGGFGGQAMCDFDNGSFVGNGTTTLTIGRFVEPGNWGVSVYIAGMVGSHTYDSAALEQSGFPHHVMVTSTPDTMPPELTALTLTPGMVSISAGPATVDIACAATDDSSGSGLNYAIVTLNTPSGGFGGQAMCDFENGSFNDSGTVTQIIGQFMEPGAWKVQVHVAGMVGARNYDSGALAALGFDHQLLVANVGLDIMPGNPDNRLNASRDGRVAVAILSSPTFAAPARVNTASLTFGRTGNEPSLVSCTPRGNDMNQDRLPDVVCFFSARAAAFQPGDTLGVLKGVLTDNSPIAGLDAVRISK